MLSDKEQRFVSWLVTQKNARGAFYLERVARHYVRYLRTSPCKLILSLPMNERNVFGCDTPKELDKMVSLFTSATNYKEVNAVGHNSFSAGLAAYHRYLEYCCSERKNRENNITDSKCVDNGLLNATNEGNSKTVDFKHTELCAGSNPISCNIDGNNIQVGTWRDLLKNIIEEFIARGNERVSGLFRESIFKRSSQPFFLKDRPEVRAKELSNGYWIYINYSIPQLVDIIGKLCTYCGYSTDDVVITYTSKHDDIQIETSVNDDKALDENGLNAVLGAIKSNYSMGLDFSPTTLRLLENKSQVDISAKLQAELKKLMFKRNDGIYLLTEQIINQENFNKLKTAIRGYMDEFSCFELRKIYITYSSFFDDKLIRDCDDFEAWLKFNGLVEQTRCVGQYGTRVIRKSDRSIQELFTAISVRISTIANDDFGGVIEEEQLEKIFSPFSTQLLFNIIKDYNEDLVRTEINGVFCYQTLDALGLSDDFSDILVDALTQIDDLGLVPNEETLNTVLSITMGLNFRAEYNLMEGKTFRRLIAHYYKNNIKREWRGGVFMEARD